MFKSLAHKTIRPKIPLGWKHFIILNILAILFIGACSHGPPHFRRSYTVERTFESYRLMPGHSYYYSGPSYNIDAVVAISNGYTLNSPHWTAVKMDERKLRQIVEFMSNTPNVADNNPVEHGAHILNDQGEIIGGWYSMFVLPILRFKSDTEFSISQVMPQITPGNLEGGDHPPR